MRSAIENRGPRGGRRGYGLVEVTLCSLLLAASMTILVQVVGSVAIQRVGADRRLVAAQEAANQMERIASRPFEAITPDLAKAAALSTMAKATLRDGSVAVKVEPSPDGSMKTITVEVRGRDRANALGTPARLVAFVHRRGEARP